jgi:hypothetical protein
MDAAQPFGVHYSDSATADDGQKNEYEDAGDGFGQGGKKAYTDGQKHADVQKERFCIF